MDVSHEMLMQILKWLRVKSLLRFRSVSKSWRCLIDDDHFIKAHFAISKLSNTRMLCCSPVCHQLFSVNQFSIKELILGQFKEYLDNKVLEMSALESYNISFIGSHNGIVCYFYLLNSDEICFFLWNPSTRETKQLAAVALPDDLHSIGFGFDESSEDYKLVLIRPKQAYVYSMRLDLWKRIELLEEEGAVYHNPISLYIKGKLYWCRMKGSYKYYDPVSKFYDIVSFDLPTEARSFIDFPFDYDGMHQYQDVNLFGDRIYVKQRGRGCGDDIIWLLNVDTCTWDKCFIIPIHAPGSEHSKNLCARVTNKGMFTIAEKGFLISLNGSTDSNSMLKIEWHNCFIPVLTWEESLVPLNRRRVHIEPSTN